MRRAALVALALAATSAQGTAQPVGGATLLVRVDDIGMSHSVNRAFEALAGTGAPLSASVMPAAPWFADAVDVLRRHPQVAVGVHLTLNSEWRGYRWGPVLGAGQVPSLVDADGYFLPSVEAFLARASDTLEVERELAAQIDRVRSAGLAVDYLDYHMGTAVATPALRRVVERLAARHQVGISRYFGEQHTSLFAVPVAGKGAALQGAVDSLSADSVGLVVIHAALDSPESRALVDLNNPAQNDSDGGGVAAHRAAEFAALQRWLERRGADTPAMITYRDLIARKGLAVMRPPAPPPSAPSPPPLH